MSALTVTHVVYLVSLCWAGKWRRYQLYWDLNCRHNRCAQPATWTPNSRSLPAQWQWLSSEKGHGAIHRRSSQVTHPTLKARAIIWQTDINWDEWILGLIKRFTSQTCGRCAANWWCCNKQQRRYHMTKHLHHYFHLDKSPHYVMHLYTAALTN